MASLLLLLLPLAVARPQDYLGDFDNFGGGGFFGFSGTIRKSPSKQPAFLDWETSWLSGEADTELGQWFRGGRRRGPGGRRLQRGLGDGFERLEEEADWIRAGDPALAVSGTYMNPRFKEITSVEPGVWFKVVKDTDAYEAKNYFIRKSNELSRGLEEQVSSGTASRTAAGARSKAKKKIKAGRIPSRSKGPKRSPTRGPK